MMTIRYDMNSLGCFQYPNVIPQMNFLMERMDVIVKGLAMTLQGLCYPLNLQNRCIKTILKKTLQTFWSSVQYMCFHLWHKQEKKNIFLRSQENKSHEVVLWIDFSFYFSPLLM